MRDSLVLSHLYLVDRVLFPLLARLPRYVDRENLRAAGLLGLVEASRRFDESAGVPFHRYAQSRVRGAMLDATRMGLVSTRRARRERRALDVASNALQSRLGRKPNAEEIATELGVTVDEVRRMRMATGVGVVVSLSEVGEDVVVVPERHLPQQVCELSEQVHLMRKAVGALPDPHREVVRRHLLAGERLADVAYDLGITCGRASQIRREAVGALRCVFADRYEGGSASVRHRAWRALAPGHDHLRPGLNQPRERGEQLASDP